MEIDGNLEGHALVFMANVIWGLMSPIGKLALTEFSALSVATFRMVGAAVAFQILSVLYRQEQIGHHDMLKIFFTPLFALVLNQGIFVFGLSLISPIDASTITTTSPIITMTVAATYLGEPVTSKRILGIFIGVTGALILILSSQVTSAGGGSTWGDLLRMVVQLSFSTYLTVFKGLSQRYSAITINKWIFIYAPIYCIPFSYQDIADIEWNSISIAAIYQILYMVLCGSFVAYICIMTAQKPMRPTIVGMYNYVQPIAAPIATILTGIGSFGWEKGVAIILVSLGVYFVT